mgnify:CR=1 FL=1
MPPQSMRSKVEYLHSQPKTMSFILLYNFDKKMKKLTGIVDDSGVELSLTTELREHDMTTMMMGAPTNSILRIPPKQTRFAVKVEAPEVRNCAQWCCSGPCCAGKARGRRAGGARMSGAPRMADAFFFCARRRG